MKDRFPLAENKIGDEFQDKIRKIHVYSVRLWLREEMEGTRRIVKGHRSEFPTSSVSLNRANLDY